MNHVHSESCITPRGEPGPGDARRAQSDSREYCLHDPAGRPIGTIAAPAVPPVLGTSAPTFYLRRDPGPD